MENKKYKTIYDFLPIFFCVFGSYLGYSNLPSKKVRIIIGGIFIALGAVMLLIGFIKKYRNKEYSKKQLKVSLVIAVAAMLVWQRPMEIYVSLLIALNFVNSSLRNLIKYIFISSAFSYIFILGMCLVGLLVDSIGMRGDTLRHSLGFSHPNICLRFYLPIVVSGAITLKNNKIFLLSSIAIALILYLFTDSRAGMGIVLLFSMLQLIPKCIKKKVSYPVAIPYLFLIFAIISIVTAAALEGSQFLNDLLSNRPYLWNLFLSKIDIIGSFFEEGELPLDNLYLHTLYRGGIYGFVFYTVLFFASFYKTKNYGNYNVFIKFLIIFIYGFVENCTSLGESFFLILVLIQLLDKEKLKEIDDDYKENIKVEIKEEVELIN